MVRDGLELICTLSIGNPYTRTLHLLAEHMFCFLIKQFIWNFKVTLLYRVPCWFIPRINSSMVLGSIEGF